MDDVVNIAYAAWPSRIYAIDTDGRVAVMGAPGPRGLQPSVRAISNWLRDHASSPTDTMEVHNGQNIREVVAHPASPTS